MVQQSSQIHFRVSGLEAALQCSCEPALTLRIARALADTAKHVRKLTELLMDPAAVVLRPGRLGLESVAVLARGVFGAEPDRSFCAACLA